MEEVLVERLRPAELVVDQLDLDRLLRRGDESRLCCAGPQTCHEALSLVAFKGQERYHAQADTRAAKRTRCEEGNRPRSKQASPIGHGDCVGIGEELR